MAALKVLFVVLISWLAGLGAYCFFWFRMDGRIDTSELIRIAAWMAIATLPFVFFYGIPISKLDRSQERQPAVFYGVACALVGVLPIAFLNLWFGGFRIQLLSPESLLMFAHFGTAGFMFGFLYAVFLRRSSTTQREDRA